MGNLANDGVKKQQDQRKIDFESVAISKEFSQLMKAKKRFLIPISITFLFFYFLLPVLTSYSTILNKTAISSISWTWVYSIGLFVMTWILCIVYAKKAVQFDKMAEDLVQKHVNKGEDQSQ